MDAGADRMQKKIRTAQQAKAPFMLIAGGKDAEDGAVSFRFRDGEQLNGVAVARAVDLIADFVGRRVNHSPSVADFVAAGGLGRAAVTDPELVDGEDFAGAPDAFQRLWTPHRMVYIGGEGKPASDAARHCPFCDVPARSDADALIISRGELTYRRAQPVPVQPRSPDGGAVPACRPTTPTSAPPRPPRWPCSPSAR